VSVTPVAGAVLVGGASRRMGRTKALIDVDGSPMVMRVATALGTAGCTPVRLIGDGMPADIG
jgi:molybdopterin-guanine dinucleotide biosynthesis protein A